MSDYDFKPLNDKEFEILCADLIGEVEGTRIERFKAGRDAGVDGRFFSSESKEVILQCKHWSNTPFRQLLRALESKEKPKLDKLKPHRYLLAISNSLSRADKKKIQRALTPHIASERDIYGKEDLNDLLKDNAHIEQRHYKLWLHSSNILGHIVNSAILGRSAFSLEEIVRSSSRYVVTENHQAALNILAKLGVVIITGEPGVGKTTLADHLCLHYVAKDFSYLRIADDIREAESAFDPDKKQIVYFDDFLGRNYLDALRGHEGSHITQFIRRIATNKNKRFVLTSRSTILSQGKFLIDSLEHSNIRRNEYEIRIQSLTELDKAKILYNHIWHSELDNEYIEELYFEKRYRKIIGHKNFNPRLISLVTDASRLEVCPHADYWEYVRESLDNPSQVWENPFVAQQDDFARGIILLVVLNGHAIDESALAEAYHRYIACHENRHLHGRHEFQSNIRLLTGSFLNRAISSHGPSTIDLFNPSIGDYVLRRYAEDIVALRLGLQSLRTIRSTITLASLRGDGLLSSINVRTICEALFEHFAATKFNEVSVAYISALVDVYMRCDDINKPPSSASYSAVLFILEKGLGDATDHAFRSIEWGLGQLIVTPEHALNFVSINIENTQSAIEIKAMSSLLLAIPKEISGYAENVQAAKEHVLDIVSDCFSDFIDVYSAFSRVDYGEVGDASYELEKLIKQQFIDLGVDVDADDVARVLDSYDVEDALRSYFENSYDGDDRRDEGPTMHAVDEVEDLFDRG
ncbi:nSTAND3 domain-containing NTPase [Nitrogeniibacter aestuarii]|uniref:nSTAND3 domain-containing NTPase n=1 Tax=Nitrogeniibacter aestuarii TaxID=2815343 RepID=UPI001D11E4A2|nr:restriction endonuclease [Nitrogeniibacter aestuarii]